MINKQGNIISKQKFSNTMHRDAIEKMFEK